MQYFQCNSSSKEYSNNQAPSNLPMQHSKNEEMASSNIGDQEKKCGNYRHDKFLRRNHENIKTYGEQLKTKLQMWL